MSNDRLPASPEGTPRVMLYGDKGFVIKPLIHNKDSNQLKEFFVNELETTEA